MKPDTVVFDRNWRLSSTIERVPIGETDVFISAHYLHKRPAVVPLCLVMRHNGAAVGCIVFAEAPRETSVRYRTHTWELARLYILDSVPTNAETWLIGQAVKYVKRHHPYVGCLVSYADPSANHKGTVYLAANWVPDGRTDGERKTPRCDYMDQATGKRYSRRGAVPQEAVVVRIPRISKYRFYLRLPHRPNAGSEGQKEPEK
jgi:hypothetical protein